MTDTESLEAQPLDIGARLTVAKLATIGNHLADQAWGEALEYRKKAQALKERGSHD